MPIRRILIANRGEIALRVIRTCKRLGIETVLAASQADLESLPARVADRTLCIGPGPSSQSYLKVETIVQAALGSGADAIHPGYGFLSERAALASLCEDEGVIFIGPTAAQIEAVGDKLRARAQAEAAGVPVVPGGPAGSTEEALALGRTIGAPLLVKAVGGGGGRGMKRVDRLEELAGAMDAASAEAGAAFGDARVYLERFVERGRHVEVQILGDGEGRVIHFGERDCSVQRRYQKLIEETPAPDLPAGLRQAMLDAAVRLGERLDYRGAGTVEFLYDAPRQAFYFLEVNARIQVEHPVTEMVTGVDLVAEQIAIAEGRGLSLAQDQVRFEGAAIECRINAEDPARNFAPSPGVVRHAAWPAGEAIRIDSHIVSGSKVPPFYDSLLAKLIAHGPDRAGAIAALRRALDETHIEGVATNLAFQAQVLADPEFQAGGVDTGYLPRFLERAPALTEAEMTTVQLVETSLRDGNQSLWAALGIDTARTLSIAPVMDRVGFKAIDFTTSTHMAVAVRYKREDPWERIRLMAAACPNTPLQFLSTGFRFISWDTASPEFMALAFKTLVDSGISRFALADPMNDLAGNLAAARMAKAGGAQYVVGALVYTLSPIHDDEHYVSRAKALAASPDVDALYIKDPGGLLTPTRANALIPKIMAVIGDKPLELHAHCTIGLGELAYMDAPGYGVTTVQCASGAAADGSSNPPSQRVVANLRALGHEVLVDDAALAEVGAYFTHLAEAEGLPVGQTQAFDAAYLHHQLPGGVVGTMRRHLAEHRISGVEAQVIEELGRVREELGWPIVMTPFAQMVLTQAVMNVTGKERYGVIPDEIIRYAIGRFGRPNVPIAPEVMDRIMSLPRTKELEAEPPMAPIAELRRRLGPNLSDEELLLRATMPAEQVDAMQAAGPAPRQYEPGSKAIVDLIRALTVRRDLAEIMVEKPGFRLALSGGPELAEA